MTHALATLLTLTAGSAYVLPFAPAPHRCPARSPAIRAFTDEEAGLSTAAAAARPHISPLTTVPELEDALAEAQALNRLCVVKVYAPWCKTCRAIEPKYKRVAKANSDEIDFYEVNFSQCKPLCKHLGVESLPCGIIFKDGEKESGIAVAREGFNVVLTSWFEADEFEEFLFDEGMGMNSFPKDLFEFIIVKKS